MGRRIGWRISVGRKGSLWGWRRRWGRFLRAPGRGRAGGNRVRGLSRGGEKEVGEGGGGGGRGGGVEDSATVTFLSDTARRRLTLFQADQRVGVTVGLQCPATLQ